MTQGTDRIAAQSLYTTKSTLTVVTGLTGSSTRPSSHKSEIADSVTVVGFSEPNTTIGLA